MKKINITLIFPILFLIFSCSKTQNSNFVEIREQMFVGQINDIYLNYRDYLGKTIKIEGMFLVGENYDGSLYQAVYRFGPGGCCGIDGIVGFEVAWAENQRKEYPNEDTWVEVIGELKTNNQNIYIELSSLMTKDIRGKEYVSR